MKLYYKGLVIDLRNVALTPESRLPVGYQNNRGFVNVTVEVNKKILNLIDNDFYFPIFSPGKFYRRFYENSFLCVLRANFHGIMGAILGKLWVSLWFSVKNVFYDTCHWRLRVLIIGKYNVIAPYFHCHSLLKLLMISNFISLFFSGGKSRLKMSSKKFEMKSVILKSSNKVLRLGTRNSLDICWPISPSSTSSRLWLPTSNTSTNLDGMIFHHNYNFWLHS